MRSSNCIKNNEIFRANANNVTSPCEGAAVLKQVLKINPPPQNEEEWILNELASASEEEHTEKAKLLLSTAVQGYEELVGTEVDQELTDELSTKSNLPLRFWKWTHLIPTTGQSKLNTRSKTA